MNSSSLCGYRSKRCKFRAGHTVQHHAAKAGNGYLFYFLIVFTSSKAVRVENALVVCIPRTVCARKGKAEKRGGGKSLGVLRDGSGMRRLVLVVKIG
jgi:hypothetical protein